MPDGSRGWDEYAPFYDWENARTMGRRDVAFWTRFAARGGRVLELGCGTGRLLLPLTRAGSTVTGVDLSAPMLARARRRIDRLPPSRRPRLVRGDIRSLPFADRSFSSVLAPYGVLQSLTSDADLEAALTDAARVLKSRGRLGIDLVPDLARWEAYQRQVRFRGRLGGAPIALVESVRQDRRRGLTIFDEEFTSGTGRARRRRRFSLTFRTVSMDAILARLERAGLTVVEVRGSYAGSAWHPEADVWLVIARRA